MMAHERLSFSRSYLFGVFALGSLIGVTSGLAVLAADSLATGRRLGIFALLGPDGLRLLFGVGAIFFVAGSLGALRRMLGDGTAAAIRYDGIVLTGIFMSRFIPWKSLDRLYVRTFRWGSTTNCYIKADARCPADENPLHHFLASLSYGVSTKLLKASDGEAVNWVEHANAARIEALTPRAAAPVPARQAGRTRVDFGRRASGPR